MLVGIALAVAAAIGTNLGFLEKHRGAVAAPAVDMRHPLRSAIDLFKSRWFLIGWGIALVAWLLHVAALSLAPLTVVQAVIAGGLVFLAVLAERWFGFHLGRRQWAGIAVTAAALAILGVTQKHTEVPHSRYSLAALIAFECAVLLLGTVLVAWAVIHTHSERREGIVLGWAAGGMFGVSDVAIKYLSAPVTHDPLALVSPWTGAALVAMVIAFYASARGLQLGDGVEVITMTSVAANLAAIVGGVLVFHDPLGSGALMILGRIVAFIAVVLGAALMPAPMRAREPGAAPKRRPERRRQGAAFADSPAGGGLSS